MADDDFFYIFDDVSTESETFEDALLDLNKKKLELEEYENNFKNKWKSELRKQKLNKLIE